MTTPIRAVKRTIQQARAFARLDAAGWTTPVNTNFRRLERSGVRVTINLGNPDTVPFFIRDQHSGRLARMIIDAGQRRLAAVIEAVLDLGRDVRADNFVERARQLADIFPTSEFALEEPEEESSQSAPPSESPSMHAVRNQLLELASKARYRSVKRFDIHLALLLDQRITFTRKPDRRVIRAFEEHETPLECDDGGIVVGIHQGGDLWGNELLERYAKQVEPCSFVRAVDDEGRFWRWTVESGEVRYFRSAPSAAARRLVHQ